jgi:peptidoglycan-associated lipoprotein
MEECDMQKKIFVLIALASAAVLTAGCASHKPRPQPTSANQTAPSQEGPQTAADNGANAQGAQGGAGTEVEGPTSAQLQNRTIYFDFDSSEIKQEYNSLITAHARYLAANTNARVRVEGNTDERGSREYNIGLGERRAQAVRRALMLQGVSEMQITTVSYGEERPAVTGHTEEAWSRNRRANIVYLQ